MKKPFNTACDRKSEITKVPDPVLLKIETSRMSFAVFKSYFAFFQRGTGVILAHDPWSFFY